MLTILLLLLNIIFSDEEGEEIMRQRSQLPALTYYGDEEEPYVHLPKSPVRRVNSPSNRSPVGSPELFVANPGLKHPTSQWLKNSGMARVTKKRINSTCSIPSPGDSVQSDSNRGRSRF